VSAGQQDRNPGAWKLPGFFADIYIWKQETMSSKTNRRELTRLWNYMAGTRLLYAGALLSVGIATLFAYAGPLVIKLTIDSIIGNQPVDLPVFRRAAERGMELLGGGGYLVHNLWICGAAVVVLTLGRSFFSFLHGIWAARSGESAAKNIRDRLYGHLQNLPFSYHVKAETGDLIQRCTTDVEHIRRFLALQFVEIGRTFFMLFLAVPVLYILSPRLFFASVPVIPVIVIFSAVFFRKVQSAFERMEESEGAMTTVLQENLTGIRVVRAFARQKHEMVKFDEISSDFKDKTKRLIQLFAVYWSLTDFMTLFQTAVILLFGSYLAVAGEISIGVLVVYITYMGMAMWPVRQLGRLLTDTGKTIVALKRIGAILDQPAEKPSARSLKPEVKGSVEFRNVSFSYTGKRDVLSHINLHIKAGETVAVLGHTGSGKSSLVQLLARLYDASEGSVLIDSVDVKDFDRKHLRRNVALVLQEPFLYAKTLEENIALARENSTREDVLHAAHMAHIAHVVEGFEHKWETQVGERGVTLSGGQKQRIAIAQALIREAPILVFDDSLSAVDSQTDAVIREALASRNKRATTIIISHRLTTLSKADLIVVLTDGRITQSGTHEQLIRQEGQYKRIWESQGAGELISKDRQVTA